jgi:transcriptional regulator with PAS, ATPase and Fis domain
LASGNAAFAEAGTGKILFSGCTTLLNDWPADHPMEFVESAALLDHLDAYEIPPATLILTLVTQDGLAKNRGLVDEAGNIEALGELLGKLQRFSRTTKIIVLTQSGLSLDGCCTLVKRGVSHFIDVDTAGWKDRLTALLGQCKASHAPTAATRDPLKLLDAVGILAISPAMQALIIQAYRGAQVSDATVLVQGESGTGKQLLAEAVHQLDPKRGKMAFVPVNCAAITGTLAESELFGHVRGAFSGATDARLGYFRTAHRGTIFLDEVSELPLHLQPKLLRVLQERRVMPVGADREEPIDVRVIAASNVPLAEKVARGEFRLDLYQRLNVIHLALPPLRNRTEDIPVLVQHFVRKYQSYCTQEIRSVDERVWEFLKRKAGAGNVRELENTIRQALVFKTHGDRLELQDLPRALLESPEERPQGTEVIPTEVANNLVALMKSRRLTLKQVVEAFETTMIQQTAKCHPTMSRVDLAKTLGVARRTLYHKLDAGADSV